MTEHLVGRGAGRRVVGQHLLLLPEDVRESDVTSLVVQRHPGAAFHPGEELRIGRHAALHGPLHLDRGAAAGAGVPAPWRLAWALTCPVERDGPPLPGLSDRDGLTRAFPGGLPVAAERRGIDLLLALARRLGGAVRVAPGGAVLTPDPLAWPGLDVRSPDPQVSGQVLRAPLTAVRVLRLLRPLVPGIVLVDAGAGPGPAQGDHGGPRPQGSGGGSDGAPENRPDGGVALVEEQRSGVLVAPAADGFVEVAVHPDEVSGASTTSLRWWPSDPADAEHENPVLAYREHRAQAVVAMSLMARALLASTGGTVVDVAGLPVRDLG